MLICRPVVLTEEGLDGRLSPKKKVVQSKGSTQIVKNCLKYFKVNCAECTGGDRKGYCTCVLEGRTEGGLGRLHDDQVAGGFEAGKALAEEGREQGSAVVSEPSLCLIRRYPCPPPPLIGEALG